VQLKVDVPGVDGTKVALTDEVPSEQVTLPVGDTL
jgi:hypothetical protein